jgi:hypothetical protein
MGSQAQAAGQGVKELPAGGRVVLDSDPPRVRPLALGGSEEVAPGCGQAGLQMVRFAVPGRDDAVSNVEREWLVIDDQRERGSVCRESAGTLAATERTSQRDATVSLLTTRSTLRPVTVLTTLNWSRIWGAGHRLGACQR